MKKIRVLVITSVLAALAPAAWPAQSDADTMALIVGRHRGLLLDDSHASTIRLPAKEAANWVNTLGGDGRWGDVDYTNRSGGAWATLDHLRRARAIAREVASPSSELHDEPKAWDAALRALGHWTEARYQNPNWWQNDIGTPQVMRDVIVLLGDRLQDAARDGAMAVLRQYKPQPPGYGANTVWTAELALMDGALSGDAAKVAEAARVIAGEIVIGGKQGIQRDYSFFQHGARLQQFHYGRSFFADTTRLAWVLRGTPWAFPAEKTALLADYAVEGCAWMCRGIATVPGTLDRAVSRPGVLGTAADLRREWAMLGDLLPERAEMFAAMRARQDRAGGVDGAEAAPPLTTGFRAFPRADFSVYHCNEYSFFLKTISMRTEVTETNNRENQKGRKLNWGDHYILRDGREYGALPPVWDWDLLPGVTSSADTTAIGRKPFAGSAGDGASGVTAMDYEALGANGARVSARKFWAAHNGVVVALIGALDADGCAPPVRTALDQCRLRGAVTAADADGVAVIAEPGRRELRGARWIHHAGLLYVPLGGAAVSLTTGPATGSWHEINNNYPDTPVTEPVFLPVMEHGVSPRGASAGFAMLACASAADAEALAARPSWRVLRNDAACQAVRFDDGAMMAAFYEPAEIPAAVPADGVEAPPIPHSEIRIPHSPSLSAAQPCIALVSQGKLFVTDPLRSGRTLTVAVGPLQFSTDCPPDGGVSPPIPINPP